MFAIQYWMQYGFPALVGLFAKDLYGSVKGEPGVLPSTQKFQMAVVAQVAKKNKWKYIVYAGGMALAFLIISVINKNFKKR